MKITVLQCFMLVHFFLEDGDWVAKRVLLHFVQQWM